MSLLLQIVLGSGLLVLCSAIHIGFLIYAIQLLTRFAGLQSGLPNQSVRKWGALVSVAFIIIVFAHTIQVWAWALSFLVLGALTTMADAIYFSIVTYTTLGYGDVTVEEGFRVFAAMAAVTGLLNFGLSTAFLVGLLSKLLPNPNK